MSSPANSDRPPTYQQVLSASQQQLQKNYAQYHPSIPMAPMIYTTKIKFSSRPVTMNCPYCGQLITTVIEEENGSLVYVLCIYLALTGFFIGCCFIPFCISELKDKIHFCPKCQRPIGKKALL